MDAKVSQTPTEGRVVKRATDGAQAARIAGEAEVLAAGQIPGVVELVSVEGDGDQICLVTTRVGGLDLGRVHDLGIDEVAGVVAAVATILADLHDLGLVHGAVMASHVLLGPDGRPVLCGLGYGGRVGDAAPADAPLPEGATDPARLPGGPLAPSADVYALGAMLRALTARAPVNTIRGPFPARWMPPGRRLGRPARPGPIRTLRPTDRLSRDALMAVADRATTVDPRLRPGARSLAAAVSAAVPGARLPRPPEPDGALVAARPEASPLPALRPGALPPAGVVTPKRVLLGGGLAAAVVGALVAARLTTAGAPGPVRALPSAPAPAPAPAPDITTTVTSAKSAPNPRCPAITAPLTADTEAGGCPEALRWTDGVLEGDDRRWVVGQPGDRVATADWSCSGHATLALLRPSTGEVFVFGEWATAGHDLVAQVAGRVIGGFAIRAADLGDGCPRLAIDRDDGTPVTLPKPPFRSP